MLLNGIHSFIQISFMQGGCDAGRQGRNVLFASNKLQEGQMVKIGGASFTDVGPSDKLSAKFITTSLKYY